MVRITREMEYALIALQYLQSEYPGKLTSVRRICDAHDLPFDATSHVLQRLKQAGVVRSQQGVNGGYQIVKDLALVSYYDLLEVIGDQIKIASCLAENCTCHLVKSCNIISPIISLNDRLAEFYRGIMIKELLDVRSSEEDLIRDRFAVVSDDRDDVPAAKENR